MGSFERLITALSENTFLLPLIPSAEPRAVAEVLSRVDPPPHVPLGIRT